MTSHSSHSSSTPHTNTTSHSSSIYDDHSDTNTITSSGSLTAQSHSVSFTSTSYTSMPSTLESSLTYLINAANEARASLDGYQRSAVTVSGDEKITGRRLRKVVRSSGGVVEPKYNWGTVTVDMDYYGAHTNSSWSNTQDSPPVIMDNDFAGYHANTTSMADPAYPKTILPASNISVSTGDSATQDDIDEALAIINSGKLSSSSVPTWGTYEISGEAHDNTFDAHSDTTSHSSHSSHSSS